MSTPHIAALALAALCAACAHRPAGPAPRELPLDYHSGGLRQCATVYEPGPPAPERRPAVVILHGGFFGEDDGTAEMGRSLSRQGVLAAAPAYRGQKRAVDGERSQGRIEFCAGEVEDALALIAELRRRPDVDPDRVALLGFSHGGCIALRAAARDPRLRAVAAFAAPVDAASTYYNLRDRPLVQFGFHGWLASRLQAFVGGEPASGQGRWTRRSPLYEAGGLSMPLLLVHGLNDELVPAEQACWLARALRRAGRPVREERYDELGLRAATGAPPLCGEGSSTLTSAGEGAPAEVRFYAGQGHLFRTAAREAAQRGAVEFLLRALQAE